MFRFLTPIKDRSREVRITYRNVGYRDRIEETFEDEQAYEKFLEVNQRWAFDQECNGNGIWGDAEDFLEVQRVS